jgi:2-dehydro-3-deoxyphosphooctonate aldolase (KDO 8-P synthase)
MPFHHVPVGPVTFGNDLPFVLVAGPCVIESRDHAFFMADHLTELAQKFDVPFVFKSSYDKANRLSIKSERGIGIQAGLEILKDIKDHFGIPVLTDVHDNEQCALAAQYVDILQIPALLCRQTDFLKAAALTGKPLNIKKGQFLAPWDMANVAKKIESTGNHNIILCERGVSFGYNQLVSDFRALEIMAKTHYPVHTFRSTTGRAR